MATIKSTTASTRSMLHLRWVGQVIHQTEAADTCTGTVSYVRMRTHSLPADALLPWTSVLVERAQWGPFGDWHYGHAEVIPRPHVVTTERAGSSTQPALARGEPGVGR